MNKKLAFTLAEILITLGVIGIVAALTMPALVVKHRKLVVEASLKKFYSTVNQAILLSINDNGETKDWNFATSNTPESIENFYSTYLKNYIMDVETKIEDIGGKSYFVVYFADGSVSAISYYGRDWNFCIEPKALQHKDVNAGIKCFTFGFYPNFPLGSEFANSNYYNKGVEPFVRNLVLDEDGNNALDENGNTIYTTEKDLYSQKLYAKIIQLNGWKIPDDYPLKF